MLERQSKSDLRERRGKRKSKLRGTKEKVLKYCMPKLQSSLKIEKHCSKIL